MACGRVILKVSRNVQLSNNRGLHVTYSMMNNTFLRPKRVILNGVLNTKFNLVTTTMIADRCLSTSRVLMEKSETKLSKKEQLKKAVKDYGSTVVVFHVSISLASLGFFYILVSSGIDMQQIMAYLGVKYKFVENAGTFVTAYAIHKLFAPVRISITLGATPFIVRYLRNKGILRKAA